MQFLGFTLFKTLIYCKYFLFQAQVLPPDELAKRKDLANKRPKVPAVPVMFFGEYTVAWITQKAVLTWSQGVEQSFHFKSDPDLRQGVTEIADFLAINGPRKAPKGWWCSPPSKGAETSVTAPLQTYIPPSVLEKTAEIAAKSSKIAPVKPQPAAIAASIPSAGYNSKASTKSIIVEAAKPTALPSKSPSNVVGSTAAAVDSTHPGPSGEKIRWSARDVLKPLVNRLKRIFPQLADEPTPSATQELFEWVHGYFGKAIDIDQQLKGKTPSDLIAEMFSRQTGKTIQSSDVAACLSASHIDLQALKEMGVDPLSWDVPLAGGPKRKQPAAAPGSKQAKVAKAPAAIDSNAAAVVSRPSVVLTDADAPCLQVMNGRLIIPAKPKGRPSSSSAGNVSLAVVETENGRSLIGSMQPGGMRLNEPPNYVHVKHNVWVSCPRPK